MISMRKPPAGLPEKLREERKKLHLTQDEMAKRLGVHKQTYWRYEKGMNIPGGGKMDAMVRMGINPVDLFEHLKHSVPMSGQGIPGPEGGVLEKVGELTIPKEGIRVAVLMGSADQQDGYLQKDVIQVMIELFWPWVIDQFGQSSGKLKTFVMNSDNMEPLIRKGDLLIIDASILEIREDGIYAFTIGGRIKIKRVFEGSDNMISISNVNRDYETDVLKTSRESLVKPASGEEKLHVEGKVIKILKNP